MSPKSPTSMESRIRAVYDELTANEARLADVILASPGEVATHTGAELSELAGISAATTTRFFRKLGYASYDEARRMARDAQQAGSPLYLQQRRPKATEFDQLVGSHLENEAQQLANTYRAIDPQELRLIVRKLTTARRVAFVGFRHSQPVAAMFHRNMLELRGGLQLLPAPGDTLGESLGDYGAQDLVVCIGLRRRVPQLGAAMEVLASQGVPLLYIADVIAGKPARFAQWVIRCHTDGMLMFDSNTAVVAVINLIYSLVGRELAALGSQHLEQIERFHEVSGELE
jgi:DNA-binding MurR/RpiR family transcriptional regulator